MAAAAELDLAKLPTTKPVSVDQVDASPLKVKDQTRGKGHKPDPGARWPKAGEARIQVPSPKGKPAAEKAGGLPVTLTAPSKKAAADVLKDVDLQVLEQEVARKAGVDGVLLAVRGSGAEKKKTTARLRVDYSGFGGMYGGDWASRLTASAVDDCALSDPDAKKCGPGSALAVHNDVQAKQLEVDVPLTAVSEESAGAASPQPLVGKASTKASAAGLVPEQGVTLVALTAAASGPTGDFGTTPLSPSGKWSAGGSSGGFSWSYDMPTPNTPGGLGPDLGLSYSSQSIDGRTAATNNQANWIADGWSLSPGSIERRYVSCEDDKSGGNNPTHKVGDLCWKKDNATLTLGGESSELVKDDSSGVWKKKQDDGTRVERFTAASLVNGDDNNEYWRLTTPDGTRYYFGYNRLPGWSEGKPETNSVWTVPVFGNHSGDPCHATVFADSWCQQAWRWNLDLVIDPHDNVMTYYWNKESDHYQRNVNTSYKGTLTPYTRGGYLNRIEYGLRTSSYLGTPAAKVEFSVAERCLPTDDFDCAPAKFTSANAKHWPDVPFDQYCTSASACEGKSSPSYFTRKMLAGVTTYARDSGSFHKVDSWELKHKFPSTGDGTDPALWLASIGRTGHAGGTDVTLPDVTMSGQQLPNRVEAAVDEIPPYNRYRVQSIRNETGSTLGVTYSAPECTAAALPSPSSNTKRCYPVIWSPPEAPASGFEPYEDWFHSYVVTQMLESDDVAGAPVMRTDYRYLGGLSWAKGDDEFTKAKHRTWGERRGYGRVQTLTGDPAEGKQTLTEDRFFRGIDGAKVADSAGAEVADHESFAGQKRESAVYNGDGGSLVTATSYTPWHSTATATRSRTADNLPAVHARHTGVKKEETRTTIAGSGTPRTTETTRTFDSYGMVDSVSESGDTAKTGDERCTTTDYHRNTGINLLDLVSETRTVAKPCGTTPSLPDDLMSATRTFYDGANDTSTAPTKGDITKEQEQDGAGTGFVTTSTAEYDAFGRQTKATDAGGATTTVAHTPATGQEPTKTVTTNDLGHVTTDISDPLRSVTTATVDPNGKRTDMEYDALGRLIKAWEPAWSKADHPKTPSAEFAYSITRTKPTVTTSKTINRNGEYESSYTFYDGLLREREAQSTALGTGGKGRVVSETFYDTRGQAWKAYSPYYAEGAPTATLVTGDDTKVPAATEIRFDGAGRTTAALSLRYGDETRRTTSQYGGDRTTVIPPKGDTATTTLTDALGRTTEKRSYTDTDRNDYLATKYTYNTRGYLAKITNPRGTEWTWVHDHRGRQTESVDPDKGRSSTTYDTSDRPVSVTDARGTTLTTVYDALGRATQLKEGNTLRAAWSYDSVAKGQPADDTRYVDGKPYSTMINSYDDRYQVTQSITTLPSSAGDLAGSYSWKFGYNAYTGATEWVLHPAIGNLPSERVTTIYGEGDLPVKTTAGQVTLVNNTAYDVFARPVRTEYGVLGRKVYRTSELDEHTGLLNRRTIDGDVALRIDDTRYGYDPAGNVTRVSSTAGQGDSASTDTQCFDIDPLRRLTQAWTTKDPKDACNGAPSAGTVGGPDSYWHTYSYDDAGNRTKQVQHATGDTETVTSAYTTPGPGEARPHSLSSVTTAGGSDAGTESFAYDKAGNTTTRTGGSHDQALDWDPEGHLQKITENGKTTEYLYDSSGNRMQTKQADGSATAYLPAGNELTVTPAGAKEATRYYMHDGETVAVRNASGFSFLFGDHQATALIAVAFGVGQTVTRRKQLPFGGSRSSTGSADWPGDRGFLGGTSDPTGYTHLGAREYDPATGRFLSVDPLFLAADPTQHNGYQYGNNNPTTFADPTGEAYEECVSGQYHCSNGRTGGTGNVTKVEFGKNYEKQTRAVGGKVSKNYYTQQATGVKFTYVKGRGTTKYTASQLSAGEKLRRQADAEHKRHLAELKKQREDAEKRAKNNEKEAGFWKSTFGTWDGWKNRVLPAAGFAACVFATVGGCMIVGAGIAGTSFAITGIKDDSWEWATLGKNLAWVGAGGGSAYKLARKMGASKHDAVWGWPFVKNTRSYKTKVPGEVGVGGGRRVRVTEVHRDWGATGGNLSINAGFNFGFCSAGSYSAGNLANVC
ncbi:RHS repeat domain-containing protein [Streptomyces sp. NBU3104]|uniref:RHS repeat domain-containing protein n=2 Tax=unclassified Streptomyces TaxID=2593676 RepID=UPI001ED9EB4F|nr:RHS repeat-associated core domain-containing protein [Streptomyces sp. NBU3104]UKL04222.1 RHS repeat protein [Streptomyces sp. NBU3104]